MIVFIIIFGLLLRLIALNQSLWWDEGINVYYAQTNSFLWFIKDYPIGDFHPFGWFAVLWIWGHIFGFSEISVRLPSVIFGALTIFLVYLTGKELFSKKVGLVAALFLSLAPLHIYYSQEARMYSMTAFAVSLSIYFLIALIKEKKFAFWGYTFSVFLILYSDYVAYFIIPAQIIYIIFYQKKFIKKFFFSLILGLSAILPWLFVFPKQLINGQNTSEIIIGWKKVVGGYGLKEIILFLVKTLVGRISFSNQYIYIFFVSLVSLPYLLIVTKLIKNRTKEVNFLLIILIAPFSFAILVSFIVPIFNYFRLIFLLPVLYLLISSLIFNFKQNQAKILITILVIFEVVCSLIYLLNSNYHREDWRSALSFIEKQNRNDLILFKNSEIPAVVKYYSKDNLKLTPGLKNSPAKGKDDIIDFSQDTSKLILFDYLGEVYDPNKILEKEIKNAGFQLKDVSNYRGVGLIYFFEIN